jgi:hypothetical protein
MKIRLPAILIGLLLFFTACEKDDIVPARLYPEMTPFEVSHNTAVKMVNEAVTYSSRGMLFDIRKGAELAFGHFNEPAKASRCGKVYTTNLSEPYSDRLLGFEGDVHVEILCSETWSIEGLKVSTHMNPDYASAETGFTAVEGFGYWTIDRVAENLEDYPVSGHYIRNGIFRYGTQTHERYNYHFSIDVDDLNLLAANYNFKEAFTADFELKVTRWSLAGEEDFDLVKGIIHFNTNGMFFVEFSGGGNVRS